MKLPIKDSRRQFIHSSKNEGVQVENQNPTTLPNWVPLYYRGATLSSYFVLVVVLGGGE